MMKFSMNWCVTLCCRDGRLQNRCAHIDDGEESFTSMKFEEESAERFLRTFEDFSGNSRV